jgi:hypothetical protein
MNLLQRNASCPHLPIVTPNQTPQSNEPTHYFIKS